MLTYINGLTLHTVADEDVCCKHLKVGEVAPRFFSQLANKEPTTYYVCEKCFEALCLEVYGNAKCCTDCRKPIDPGTVVKWAPYDTNPQEPQFILCEPCANSVQHIERVEHDRAMFNSRFHSTRKSIRKENHL